MGNEERPGAKHPWYVSKITYEAYKHRPKLKVQSQTTSPQSIAMFTRHVSTCCAYMSSATPCSSLINGVACLNWINGDQKQIMRDPRSWTEARSQRAQRTR